MNASANEKKDAALVKGMPPVYYIVAIAVAEVIHRFVFPLELSLPSLGPVSGLIIRVFLGIVVVGLGVAMMISSNKQFQRTKNDPEPWTATNSIITSGIYARTRNPIYLAAALMMIGIGVMLGDLWILIFTVPVLVIIHIVAVLPEEKYLEEKFGEAYAKYKSSVRRWV